MLGSSIQQNLIDTVLLREQTGQPNARFDTGISVVPLTPAQAHVDQTYEGGPLNEVINSILLNWIYWGLLVPMSTGLLASSFVVLPSMEICNEARELQLMTGLTGCTYLGTHFLFDLLFYFVPMTTLYLGFSMINNLSDSTQATLRLVMALSAPVNILLPYLISEYSADSGTAYAVVMALYAIGGPGVVMAYILAATLQEEGVRWPFLFFPPFQLPAATVRAINFEPEIAACHYVMHHNDSKYNHNYFCWAGRKLSATIKICCDGTYLLVYIFTRCI
ncbi:uncharacterized protein LOC142814698 [Rhipicephalus microplus]|uniref:uncharacterized protein LOC142814698 n=1 Tax=Rhipicephalus microplus TaxID=6941 RepID=UPI003F6C0A0A